MRFLAALCLALLAATALAGTAGQVMFAYGETHALRQGRIIQLDAGSSVESGDQLHTGVNSYLQIRFTDWGVMSLRPRTDFVIDQYTYEQNSGGVERAFFSLLNGGVRSLTGMIGRRNHDHYRMRTNMASIGIRGTHYAVLICSQDCKLDDGSLGEDGVYGGVIEGRIAISPYGGSRLEREFGAGEYFRLSSANIAPERFAVPPPFFWDKREPQARGGGSTFAGITWKPTPGAPSEGSGPEGEVGGVAGSLLRTDGSLTLSPITAPVLNQVGAPAVNGVVLPAAGLAGSIVNSALAMPTLGQAAPLAGPVLNAVPVVVAPVVATVGGVVNTVVPVIPPVIVPPVSVPPIAVPPIAVPPVAVPPVAVPPVAVPPVAVPPVAVPPVAVPPVAVPPVAVPPVAVPPIAVPPIAVPPVAIPPVTVPTVPPVTVPTPAPPPVIAPAPPPVALPTLPSLPLSKSFVAPLKR